MEKNKSLLKLYKILNESLKEDTPTNFMNQIEYFTNNLIEMIEEFDLKHDLNIPIKDGEIIITNLINILTKIDNRDKFKAILEEINNYNGMNKLIDKDKLKFINLRLTLIQLEKINQSIIDSDKKFTELLIKNFIIIEEKIN